MVNGTGAAVSKEVRAAQAAMGIASLSEVYDHEPMWAHYLSPDAARLMGAAVEGFGAAECQRPESDTVSLLMGHDSARDTSFATQL